VSFPLSSPRSRQLPLASQPDPAQLESIKAQLDLVLMALEALASIGSEAILQAAETLNLSQVMTDRVSLWRLRQASPLRKGQGGRKKLDVEEARALVMVVCHLAHEHQSAIRQAVAQLEAVTIKNQPPHRVALLGDYLDAFCNAYQERMTDGEDISPDDLNHLAFRLLIDLLFYAAPNGARRLWLALLDRAKPQFHA